MELYEGDCLEVMRGMADASVDAVVTDPPAGISFMGKSWDKPGVLGVSGGRAMPATLAGRNPICRGCRKHQRGKAPRPVCQCAAPDFDTHDGRRKERDLFIDFLTLRLAECHRLARPGARMLCWAIPRTSHWTATAIEDAGWTIEDRISHIFGQGFPKHKSKLKPACEDWWLAIKPARRAVELNIDDCRIESVGGGGDREGEASSEARYTDRGGSNFAAKPGPRGGDAAGRWPAHVVFDEEAGAMLDEQSGERPGCRSPSIARCESKYRPHQGAYQPQGPIHPDTGGASRFFYCPKANRSDRGDDNTHPTVKNTDLMRWLVRLVTAPGDLVLDPFAGSGSTGKACRLEGRDFLGIERDPEYAAIARRRIDAARAEQPLFA